MEEVKATDLEVILEEVEVVAGCQKALTKRPQLRLSEHRRPIGGPATDLAM